MLKPIPVTTAVHLCLDMQKLFAPGGPWPTPWLPKVVPNVVRLCERFAERTVFTRFIPPRRAEDAAGMWRSFYRRWPNVTLEKLDPDCLHLVPDVAGFMPPAQAFDKGSYSAFADGRLAPWLAERRVATLVVSGAETDICVLSSVMAAVDHGFRVVLVTDAVCSSSDAAHDALMRMYEERLSIQIELASTEEALAVVR